MPDTGFLSPTVSTNAGTWTTPDNVFASDDARATKAVSAGVNTGYVGGNTFGAAITDGSTIDGIEVVVEASQTGLGEGQIQTPADIEVSKDGTTFFRTTFTSLTLTGTDATVTAGGATDLWGTTWTEANVEGAAFEARAAVTEQGLGSITARIDHIKVKIYSTEAPKGGGLMLLGVGSVLAAVPRFFALKPSPICRKTLKAYPAYMMSLIAPCPQV